MYCTPEMWFHTVKESLSIVPAAKREQLGNIQRCLQLDELRSKVEWYEGRVRELETAQHPSSTMACTAEATPPSDNESPCALLKPPATEPDSRWNVDAVTSGPGGDHNMFVTQAQVASSVDGDLLSRGASAPNYAERDYSDAQKTLNDLLVPSEGDTTPRGASARQNPERNVHSTSLDPSHPNEAGSDRCRSACSTFSCDDEENTPVGTGSYPNPYDGREASQFAHEMKKMFQNPDYRLSCQCSTCARSQGAWRTFHHGPI